MSERGRSSLYLIFTRLIDSLRPTKLKLKGKFIDSDYLGNSYYEISADQTSKKTPKRWFVPKTEDNWDKELPPEWDAWLRLKRKVPPTKEEIDYNLSVEMRKKEFDKQNKPPDKREVYKNPYSSFPSYNEYEQNPLSSKKDDK